eukprot:TRINITY_DN4636_c0_g3_i3.p1 TRINITY_DN4636_c0_g3~~TRINITY_DN4636_c0_g3_i3.p1  ORF type:complete len:1099 (+),score=236.54 TRINITY_DN4636_c0_g3_i3:81-3299(+)
MASVLVSEEDDEGSGEVLSPAPQSASSSAAVERPDEPERDEERTGGQTMDSALPNVPRRSVDSGGSDGRVLHAVKTQPVSTALRTNGNCEDGAEEELAEQRSDSSAQRVESEEGDAAAAPSRGGPRKGRLFSRLRLQIQALKSIVDIAPGDLEEEDSAAANDDGKGIAALKTTRKQVAKAMEGIPRLLPDARWRRWWDTLQLLVLTFHGYLVPLVLVKSFSHEVIGYPHLFASILWTVSAFVRMDTAFVKEDGTLEVDRHEILRRYWKTCLLIDLVSAPPYDSIALWVGASARTVRWLSALRLSRLWLVRHLFDRSNPMIMTPQYVTFHFSVAPILISFFWAFLALHTLVVLKLAVGAVDSSDEQSKNDERYDYALFWVWNLLTTSPAPLTLVTYEQRVLCFFLMFMGVFFQGVIIGRVSFELLKHSIEEQNIETLRTTLQVVRQYNVPEPLQQEVLSLQWHNLQSSLSAITRSEILTTLPPVMRNEIVLYIKIDFIDRVTMFQTAAHHTKVLLADALKQMYFEPGEYIIREGDVGNEMYFMLHGYCDVLVPGVGSVGKLNKGQCFGEVALLTQDRRTASIRALTYCDCLRLDKEDFDRVCEENPEFQEAIVLEAKSRTKDKPPPSPSPAPAEPKSPKPEAAAPSATLGDIVKMVAEERATAEREENEVGLAGLFRSGLQRGSIGECQIGSGILRRPMRRRSEPTDELAVRFAHDPQPAMDPFRLSANVQEDRLNASTETVSAAPRSAVPSPGPRSPLVSLKAVSIFRGLGKRADKYRVPDDSSSLRDSPDQVESPRASTRLKARRIVSMPGARVCKCGATVFATSKFCSKCGKKNHAKCPCGADVSISDKFCASCGEMQQAATPLRSPTSPQRGFDRFGSEDASKPTLSAAHGVANAVLHSSRTSEIVALPPALKLKVDSGLKVEQPVLGTPDEFRASPALRPSRPPRALDEREPTAPAELALPVPPPTDQNPAGLTDSVQHILAAIKASEESLRREMADRDARLDRLISELRSNQEECLGRVVDVQAALEIEMRSRVRRPSLTQMQSPRAGASFVHLSSFARRRPGPTLA